MQIQTGLQKVVNLHFNHYCVTAAHLLQEFSLLLLSPKWQRSDIAKETDVVVRHLFSVWSLRHIFHQNTNNSLCASLYEWTSNRIIPFLPPVQLVLCTGHQNITNRQRELSLQCHENRAQVVTMPRACKGMKTTQKSLWFKILIWESKVLKC